MNANTTVQPGQVWADNDWRSEGRTLRVESVSQTYAHCVILTNDSNTQARIDRAGSSRPTAHYAHDGTWVGADRRGKTTRIRLDRFRPTTTGYRLVEGGAS